MNHDLARDLAAGFVLGALEPDEMAAVRDHLATCPEPHPEYAELGGVVAYLVEDVDLVEPPAGLRERVLAAAAAEPRDRPAVPAVPPPAPVAPAPTPISLRRRTSPVEWALRIAAVAAVAVLGASNLLLRDQLARETAFRESVTAVIEAAGQPGSQVAVMADPENPAGPRGIAAVRGDGSIQLAMQGLSPTTGSEVYEAWMIVGEQAPVPVGGFTVGADGTASFLTRPGPAAAGVVVALTREPAPNATSPTLPIVALGVAGGPPG